MWYSVEGVDVVDYVEHAVGRGRFRDFQLFESVDSPWVVFRVLGGKFSPGLGLESGCIVLFAGALPTAPLRPTTHRAGTSTICPYGGEHLSGHYFN